MSSASGPTSAHLSFSPTVYPLSVPRTRANRKALSVSSVAQTEKRHFQSLSGRPENSSDDSVSAVVKSRFRTKGETARIELHRTPSATSVESADDCVYQTSSPPSGYYLPFESCQPSVSSSFAYPLNSHSDKSMISRSIPDPSSSSPPPTSPLASFSCLPLVPSSSPAATLPASDYFQTPTRSTRRCTKKTVLHVENGKTASKDRSSTQRCSVTKLEVPPSIAPPSVSYVSHPIQSTRAPSPPPVEGELNQLRLKWKEEAQMKEASRPLWLIRSKREGRAGKGVDVKAGEGGEGRRLDLWEMKNSKQVNDEGREKTEGKRFCRLSSEDQDQDQSESHMYSSTSSPSTSTCSSTTESLLSSPSSSASCSSSRSSSPFARQIPRTVSAPALLLLSTGKASLSTAQILSTDMDWLIPSSTRQRVPRSLSISSPSYQSNFQPAAIPWSSLSLLPFCSNHGLLIQPASASKKRSDETRRSRLAAFEGHNSLSTPNLALTGSLASDGVSSSKLGVVKMMDIGRIAVSLETFKTMLKIGSVNSDEPLEESSLSELGETPTIAPSTPSISKPDWPDTSYPWSFSAIEAHRVEAERRKAVLEAVGRYLDDDAWDESDFNGPERLSDHPLSRNWSTSSSSVESTHSTRQNEISGGGGGKTGFDLRNEVAKRPKVRYGLSRPMLGLDGKQFDPADARQALLLRNQTRGSLSCVQLEKKDSGKEVIVNEQDVLGCFCQCEMEDEAVVNCDSCQTWHHMSCIGLMPDDLDEEWFCWKCEPSDDSLSSSMIDPSSVLRPSINQIITSPPFQASPFFSSPPSSPILQFDSQSAASRTSCRKSDLPIDDRFGKSWNFFQTTPPTTDLDEGSSDEEDNDDDDDDDDDDGDDDDADYTDEDSFDPSSTPSKHLSAEDLLFGSTPLPADRPSSVSSSSILYTTPSHPSPCSSPPSQSLTSTAIYKLRSTANARSNPPGLEFDICPSSADSEGPLSPYKLGWEGASSPLLRPRLTMGSCSKVTNEQENGLEMGLLGAQLGGDRW